MKPILRLSCLVVPFILLDHSSSVDSQSLTTIITSSAMIRTEDLALSDHGAAFIARTGGSSAQNEVFAYVFAVHKLLTLTTNSVEEHSLFGSGDRLVWVEGRSPTADLKEYIITRNALRSVKKPPGSLEMSWIKLHQGLAMVHDASFNHLWHVDLATDSWETLSNLFRHGKDCYDLNGRSSVWCESQGVSWGLLHKSPGSSTTTVRVTQNGIDRVRVRHPFVAWQEKAGSGQTYEIFSHDLTTKKTTQITQNTWNDTKPALVGNLLVWLSPLHGVGQVVLHYKDLATNGPVQILGIQARDLQAAWDGVYFPTGPNGRTLAHYNFLESRSTTFDTALDIQRPDSDGNGRMVMYRKLPEQIKLVMPQLDVRPADPFAWDRNRMGIYLVAGPLWGSSGYHVAASVSGFRPGIQIGFINVPLNPDPVLMLSIQLANIPPFENTKNTLSPFGSNLAYFNPDPGLRQILIGLDIYWAYVLLPPRLASNVVRMRFRP